MPNKKGRESLAAQFERHADEEGKILAEYRALSEKLKESAASFLIDLILTEEELHHLLLRTTAKWLREPPAAAGEAVPPGNGRDEILRRTQELKKHEKETIDACRSMRLELSTPDADVVASVLEVMALDSEKHHQLLLTVEKMLARGR
ncbi:MAG: hypothetical protein HY701_04030 [Gemmatimonadetes bacterium]|nr:hypothetical protein [Gemmatimonadota bacterium]